jgi:hypothetical protein
MSAFSDIVGQANTMVKGIDWDTLDSQSRGIPLDPNVAPKLGYWVDYLAPAFDKAADVMNTLYYDPQIVNIANTQDAVDVLYRLLQDVSPQMQAYQRFNNPSLIFSPMPLPIEDFRLMISYVWGLIMYGTKLHTTFAITAVGRQKWREHADHIVRLCEALAMLDSFGALSRLKWDSTEMVNLRAKQGVSSIQPFSSYAPPSLSGPDGLGSYVVVGIVVAVGAAVLIYGIYEWSVTTSEINRQTLQATQALCSDPNYANDPETKDRCVKVLGDALAKSTMITPPTNTLFKYAIIAVSVGAAIWFLPTIVRSLRGAAAEARKPATA